MESLKTEILVIGSGPGGAVTACTLSEAGRDVLVIEEGSSLAVESCRPFSVEEMELKYRNGGLTFALGAPKINYVEGKVVGGGSEVNAGLYHRTPAPILERWAKEFQLRASSEKEMLPHFEECERDLSVSLSSEPFAPSSLKLKEGTERLGWKVIEAPRWYKGAERQSMSRTLIPRTLQAGGKLLSDTRVLSLKQVQNAWEVRVKNKDGATTTVSAQHVFVCAGAIQTPGLLLRSGIRHNIGKSFQLHPTIKVFAEFEDDVNFEGMGVPVHQVKEFSPDMSFGCSISSPPFLALGLLDHPGGGLNLQERWKKMATYYAMITPTGKGTIRSVPGFGDPLVQFKLSTRDHENLVIGLKRLSLALLQAGAKRLYPSVYNLPVASSSADVDAWASSMSLKRASLMTIHLFSSCPMGENKKVTAVDSFGRVHDLSGLYISDASILCTAPGVNPQGSVMAFAKRNALKFLGRL